jgi:hypothetical protein
MSYSAEQLGDIVGRPYQSWMFPRSMGQGGGHAHGHHGAGGARNFVGGDGSVTDTDLVFASCPAGWSLYTDPATGMTSCVPTPPKPTGAGCPGPSGVGYATLAEHGAVCPPGYVVVTDTNGDEVCIPAPSARGMGATPTDVQNWATFKSAITAGQQAINQTPPNIPAAQQAWQTAYSLYQVSPYVQNQNGVYSGDGVGGDQLDYLLGLIGAAQGVNTNTAVETTQGMSTDILTQNQEQQANLATQIANSQPSSVSDAFVGSLETSAKQEASDISAGVSKAGAAVSSIFDLGKLKDAGIGAAAGVAVGGALGALVVGSNGLLPGSFMGGVLGGLAGYLLGEQQAAQGAAA